MLRDGRIVFFPLAILALFLASYFFFQSAYQPDTKPVPETELNQPPVLPPAPEPVWFVRFAVENQKSTYYTSYAEEPASASSRGYFLGSGAVHPRHPLNEGGNALEPIIPFGTTIFLAQPVEIQGNWYDTLEINDTGDVNYRLWRQYPYWVDVYAGTVNYYTEKAALEQGIDLIDYHWYEPWQ